MFIGHYAAGLAAKKIEPKVSLGVLFMGTQLLDLLFPLFVLLGLEDVRFNHSLGTFNGLDLIHVPWSHGLVASLLWSLLAAGIGYLYYKTLKASLVIGLSVFSHWILDWVTHIPDLPLFMSAPKFGLGLWTSTYGTLAVEGIFFITSVVLYLKTVSLTSMRQKILFWSMLVFLMVIYLGNILSPMQPESLTAHQIVMPMLGLWLMVFWGHFADKK